MLNAATPDLLTELLDWYFHMSVWSATGYEDVGYKLTDVTRYCAGE